MIWNKNSNNCKIILIFIYILDSLLIALITHLRLTFAYVTLIPHPRRFLPLA